MLKTTFLPSKSSILRNNMSCLTSLNDEVKDNGLNITESNFGCSLVVTGLLDVFNSLYLWFDNILYCRICFDIVRFDTLIISIINLVLYFISVLHLILTSPSQLE